MRPKTQISYEEAVEAALNAGHTVGEMLQNVVDGLVPDNLREENLVLTDTVLQGGIIFGLLAIAAAIRDASGNGPDDSPLAKLFNFPNKG